MRHTNFTINGNPVEVYTSGIESILCLFIKRIATVAVPCFYIMSGFFFFNVNTFIFKTFRTKIKKRINSLILPYLLWNLITYLVLLCKDIVTSSETIEGGLLLFDTFIMSFMLYNGSTTPISAPLWFLRDLIFVIFMTPIIYLCLKKCPYVFLIGLTVCFFYPEQLPLPWNHIYKVQPFTALLFFSMGSYIAINKNKLEIIRVPISNSTLTFITLIYFTFIMLVIYTKNPVVRTITTYYIGVPVTFIIAIRLLNSRLHKHIIKLNPTYFFLFALHILLVNSCNAIVLRFIPQDEVLWLFIVSVFLNVILCITAYYTCRKIFPRIAYVLSGGRK